jgi:hypothetical protein
MAYDFKKTRREMRRRGKGWLLFNIIFSKKFVGRYM